MSAKELIVGVPLASLLWLVPVMSGCGHGSGASMAATTPKGYHSVAPPPHPAPAAPTPTPVQAPAQPVSVAAAPAPAPATTVVLAQPTTLAPPRRAYEPPMPLEPGKATSVVQPMSSAAANNGPNTTASGQRFAVRGVDPSDVLNIRSGPSATYEVVGSIPPDGNGVIPLGGRRQIGPSVWREVSYRGVRGWVNDRFLVEEQRADQSR